MIPNVNTVDTLAEVWPRLSSDERRLFDVIARSCLAAMMSDFRYRQTTVVLDVAGHPFRAVGRQPVELGWRAAFPDWQPAEEKGEDAQLLPGLRDGEAALLRDATVEDKEIRPPPRYNEGTLIDAMQNAWRFVNDNVLRDRLREAKGIGTPATRAEVIHGLKAQEFLVAAGKHIVPTERGLALFGVLEHADPALVDPGVTAQLECLLDEVLVGRQEMMGAIDAVCLQAERIIGRLTAGTGEGSSPGPGLLLDAAAGMTGQDRPPTPAMRCYVDSLVRQKGLAPPSGYAKSGRVCRAFLDQHASKAGTETADGSPRPAVTAHGAPGEGRVPDQGRPIPGISGPVPQPPPREPMGTSPSPQGRCDERRRAEPPGWAPSREWAARQPGPRPHHRPSNSPGNPSAPEKHPCAFPSATRTPRCGSERATVPADGMRRPEQTSVPFRSMDGCDKPAKE